MGQAPGCEKGSSIVAGTRTGELRSLIGRRFDHARDEPKTGLLIVLDRSEGGVKSP
jgi:hypothetical protein